MSNVYHSLAGGALTQNWSNTGLITISDNWSGVPSIEGFLGQDITIVTDADPQTLTTDSGLPNDLDVIANQSNPDTLATGGVAEFDGIADPTIALNGSGTADAPHLILYLDTTGVANVRVQFDARDLDGSADDANSPLAVQYRVGSSGPWINLPSAFIPDATQGPSLATLVTHVDVTLPAAAANQSQVQVRIITSNSSGNDEWIGIDNISVTSSTSIVVTTLDDTVANDGFISLREAVAMANATPGADTITFAVSGTITLLNGQLAISDSVTIDGDTNGDRKADITISGNDASRVFDVSVGGTVATFQSLNLTDGNASSGNGGAIRSAAGTTVTVIDSTISDSVAAQGGGVYGDSATLEVINSTLSENLATLIGGGLRALSGNATVINTTIHSNQANGAGGAGIDVSAAGSLTILDSTITGNNAISNNSGATGGVFFAGSSAIIRNSVIAGNTGLTPDLKAASVTAGWNFFGTMVTGIGTDEGGNIQNGGDPLLGILTDNGGPVATRVPLAGSPLIGAGNAAHLPADTFDLDGDGNTGEPLPLDAKGDARVVSTLDIGAAEVPPLPTLAINDVSVNEAAGTMTFTVTRTGANTAPITVQYATADDSAVSTAGGPGNPDFSATSGTLTFAISANATETQTFTVALNNDNVYEAVEQFFVNLSNASGATISDALGVGTINNDDAAPTIAVNDIAVNENGTATFTVTLTGATALPIAVDYQTADGTAVSTTGGPGTPDFTATSGTLTFNPSTSGTQTLTVTVPLNNDGISEPAEQFALNLFNPTNGATITDGQGIASLFDPPTLSINDVTMNEAAGTMTFTVTRTGANYAPITVQYATADDSAVSVAGEPGNPDFSATSGTLTFAPSANAFETQTFTVAMNSDNVYEAVEQFVVNLSNASGATITDGQGVGTINNDDAAPTISVDDIAIDENGTASFTVTLTGATALPISVDYATADGTAVSTTGGPGTPDFTAKSGTLTFNPSTSGTQTLTVTMLLNNDTTHEPAEQFALNLFNPTNGATISDAQGIATINDDDPVPTYSVNDVTRAEGDSGTTAFTFTVSLSNQTADVVTVGYATVDGTATVASGDYAAANGVLTFAPGETTKTVTVLVNGDRVVENDEMFGLILLAGANAIAGDTIGVGTIVDDETTRPFDFNGDGKSDLLFQHTDGSVAVWLLDGVNLTSAGLVLPNSGPSWKVKDSADFDGDGKSDILWQYDSGMIGVWLMDGAGTKQIGGGLNPGSAAWHAREGADFNGDGKADVLWQHDNGTVGVWLMNGTSPATIGGGLNPGSASWHVTDAADFNGDGKADILWQHDGGMVGVWLMDGTNVLSIGGGINPGSGWHAEAAGDFNGDGKADILWQRTDGAAAVWLMDGTSIMTAGAPLTNPGAGWHVKEAVDTNGDGKADIIWQHDNGTPAVWLMDGVNVTSSGGPLSNPGASWHIV